MAKGWQFKSRWRMRIYYGIRDFLMPTRNRIGNWVWLKISQPHQRRKYYDKPYKATLRAAKKRKR